MSDDTTTIDAPVQSFESAQPAPTRQRRVNQTTRAAFAAKFGDQGTSRFDPKTDTTDDLVPAIDNPAAAGGAESTSPPASSPPAAAPSPESSALDAHRAEQDRLLDERERALSEKERSHRDLMDRFRDDPAHTIQEMLREAHGIDATGDVRPLAMDLVSDLSGTVLGLEVPESVKSKAERRKVERLLKEHQAKIAKQEREFAERQTAQETAQRDQAAQAVLASKLDERKASYPNLMLQDTPHLLVWRTAEALSKRDPNWVPSWEDAAKRAETHLAASNKSLYEKLKKLYDSKSTTPDPREPGSRAPVAITNVQTQEASSVIPPVTRALTTDERRKRSMDRLAKSLRPD